MQGVQKLFPSALPAQKATKKSGLKSQNKKAGNKKGQKKFMAQLVDSTEEQAMEFKYQQKKTIHDDSNDLTEQAQMSPKESNASPKFNEISMFNCSENESFNESTGEHSSSHQTETNSTHNTSASGQEDDSQLAENLDSKSGTAIKLINGL